jgi:NADH-quinone oxidoreductase subunit J
MLILFLIFLLVLTVIGVGSSKTTVYSVFLVVFSFVLSSIIFLICKAEFLSFVLLIVYVGAVIVFFLFVTMMIKFEQNFDFDWFKIYLNIFFSNFIYLIIIDMLPLPFDNLPIVVSNNVVAAQSNTVSMLFNPIQNNLEVLGLCLYTNFAPVFVLSGVVLLVSIIGCIILTSEIKDIDRKRQIITDQHLKIDKFFQND